MLVNFRKNKYNNDKSEGLTVKTSQWPNIKFKVDEQWIIEFQDGERIAAKVRRYGRELYINKMELNKMIDCGTISYVPEKGCPVTQSVCSICKIAKVYNV
jgi:uncharacterized protein YhdP